MLGVTLRPSDSGLGPENLCFSQISRCCWCFWLRDYTLRAICLMFFLLLHLLSSWNLFLWLLVTLSWFACHLTIYSSSFLLVLSPCSKYWSSSELSSRIPVFTYYFSGELIQLIWLDIPTKCWWLSHVFISQLVPDSCLYFLFWCLHSDI